MSRTRRQRLRLAMLRAFAGLTQPLVPKPHSPGQIKEEMAIAPRILVVRPDHLGDMLFATPALQVLRQRYPEAHITALVGPWGSAVLTNNPHVDEIITLPFPGFSRERKPTLWQPYRLLGQWAQQLRGRYDLAFILRFDHWWGALLAYLAGVPERVGYALPEVAPFLSHAVPYASGRHEVEQNLRLVARELPDGPEPDVNWPPAQYPLEFHIPEQAIAWAKALVRDRRPIAIHPGAGAAIKLWRAERWAAVADTLARETGADVLLTGAEAERPGCQEIAAQMETEAQVMAGETSLDQLAALLSRCRLVLGLDSGPLHLGVAVGTPSVQLYGPADPAIFGPWGPPEKHRVLISAWPCIPCNRLDYSPHELVNHPCVQEVDVPWVLAAARELLAA
jgi:lipopolysaccharide heptosyltransferase II